MLMPGSCPEAVVPPCARLAQDPGTCVTTARATWHNPGQGGSKLSQGVGPWAGGAREQGRCTGRLYSQGAPSQGRVRVSLQGVKKHPPRPLGQGELVDDSGAEGAGHDLPQLQEVAARLGAHDALRERGV